MSSIYSPLGTCHEAWLELNASRTFVPNSLARFRLWTFVPHVASSGMREGELAWLKGSFLPQKKKKRTSGGTLVSHIETLILYLRSFFHPFAHSSSEGENQRKKRKGGGRKERRKEERREKRRKERKERRGKRIKEGEEEERKI